MIEDTSKRDPQLHLIGAMSADGIGGYIEEMEADGQRQVVGSAELMPADGPWKELVKLGFGEPQSTDDPMFVRSSLPPGWRKIGTDHSMHSSVVDERDIKRIGVFYKAAFYDRRADCYVIAVGGGLATKAIYGDQPPTLPEQWSLLTAEERSDFISGLDAYLAQAEESPDIYGDRVERVRSLKAAASDG